MLKTHSRNSQTMFVNCGGQNCSPSRYFPASRRQLNSRSWVFASTIINFLGFLFYLPDWRQDLQTWQRLGGSRSDTKQGNTWHSSSPHHSVPAPIRRSQCAGVCWLQQLRLRIRTRKLTEIIYDFLFIALIAPFAPQYSPQLSSV